MFYFIHVLAGAAIAKYFPNLSLLIILSIIFHFLIDIIPHRDNLLDAKLSKNYKVNITKKVVLFESVDFLISIALTIFIWIQFYSLLMLIAIFASILPDLIKIGYLTKMKKNKIFKKYIIFHSRIQTDVSWTLGIIIQFIVTAILLKILF